MHGCHVGKMSLRHQPTSPSHPPSIQNLPLLFPFPRACLSAWCLRNWPTVSSNKHEPPPQCKMLAASDSGSTGAAVWIPGLGRARDKGNKWRRGGSSCSPAKEALRSARSLLCFSFLKGKTGRRSLPQGLFVTIRCGSRAMWPGSQGSPRILKVSSKKQGEACLTPTPEPQHRASLKWLLMR